MRAAVIAGAGPAVLSDLSVADDVELFHEADEGYRVSARFTNAGTGHGMFVSTAGVKAF